MNKYNGDHNKFDMNKSLLQLIVKISDTKSFTKAGLELNMTQPAVSRAVTALEAELGVTLLTRNRRLGVKLTDVGERVVQIFRKILNEYEKIDQEIALEKGLETGIVRIGAFPVASAYFLPKIISHIAKQYPNIEFTIFEGTNAEIKEWIESGRIDVGFIVSTNDELSTFPLLREEMFAVLADDHPLSEKDVIQASDLKHDYLIICKSGFEPPVLEWFERSNQEPQVKYVLHNNTTALNMVKEGMGIAIMSELSLSNIPNNIVIRKLEPQGYRDIHVATLSMEDASIAVKHFIHTTLDLFPQRESH
ncbi:LysR family transcriptional regulator [Paenibacillus tyrfis]|uniref:LysR family transcriptional regulator n=1 Tax=Paenibacillus tyrfis TaxID=1501230 RepID=UPI0021665F29|nr:LysR family transcriptional regulator [Paenibacillus tyrfis]